ncbi:niemann pick type c2 protein npc2-related [Anaeramoeba flamelloides]|uniref:Niemann pick type c2 protein npc2-related n=1 Tax=Anaeramoeba flamelloides TaxID=1746091 RepID=A0AAV7YJF7_9EUKA|nr:niemann pick type c2 protein npc2-related [Anaeramoeba flamelloides]
MLKFLFIVCLFVTFASASIEWKNCNDGKYAIQLEDLQYTPEDAFIIGEKFSFNTTFEISEEIPGGTITISVYHNDFNGDPWLEQTATFCEYFYPCPVAPGTYVRKAESQSIPDIPQGQYLLHISLASTDKKTELACVEFEASVSEKNNPTPENCEYSSNMNWEVDTNDIAIYEQPLVADRHTGSWMQVGDLGPYDHGERGTFSKLQASEDNTFGEAPTTTAFQWCLNATVTEDKQVDDDYEITYEGDVWIGSEAERMSTWERYYMRGNVEFTGTWDGTSNELKDLTGTLNFNPAIHVPKSWSGPVSYGKLNPLPLSYFTASDIVQLIKSDTICQCEYDICGVCGGDNSTCTTPTPTATPTPSPTTDTKSDDNNNTIIAVSIIVPIAVIAIVIILVLVIRQRKQKKVAQTEIISANRFGNTGMSWSQITKENVKSTFSKSGSTGNTGNDEEGSDDDFSFDPTDDDSLEDLDDSD